MTPEQERELADAIVECGIIEKDSFQNDMYSLKSTDGQFVGVRYEAREILRDGRVVLAMMQKLSYAELIHALESSGLIDGSLVDEIELVQAGVKALRGEG